MFSPVFLHFLIRIYFYIAHMALVKSLSIKKLKKYLHNYNRNNYFWLLININRNIIDSYIWNHVTKIASRRGVQISDDFVERWTKLIFQTSTEQFILTVRTSCIKYSIVNLETIVNLGDTRCSINYCNSPDKY